MARGEFIMYRGAKYWLQTCGRYYSTRHPINGERLLHRRIWVDRHGPIPKVHEVHHKDDDWRNSHIDNLECLPKAKHRSEHSRKRWKSQPERYYAYLELARAEASK